jgi:hypothetical protein
MNRPCKVAVWYSTGRKPSRIWQKMPPWLREEVPWASEGRLISTEVIDLRGTPQPAVATNGSRPAAKTLP